MSLVAASSGTVGRLRHDPLRIMVIDDSVVVRGLLSRWIETEPDMMVAASLRTGLDAVRQVEKVDPDVAILDIEMPDLDGISALPQLLAKKRDLVVIMASTLTRRNAEISLKALSLGAVDYIPKPESTRNPAAAELFRHDLVQKIRHFGQRRRTRQVGSPPLAPALEAAIREPLAATESAAPLALRPFGLIPPRALLIGASTGGPQALISLVRQITPVISGAPVLITQHMPPTFTTILAEHLAKASGRTAAEGIDGEAVVAGRIYLAPGGSHMRVAQRGATPVIAIDDGPPVNFCKPAVDPLFASAAAVWQSATLGVVLTGMGSDGARGGRDIVTAGGSIIAQDEATSVVWGMPGAVAQAGLCAAVLPLEAIGPRLNRLFSGERA